MSASAILAESALVALRMREFATTFPDVRVGRCWGEEAFFFHPPAGRARRGRIFLTIRERPDGVRISLPAPRAKFRAWFGPPPPRARAGQRVTSDARHGAFRPHPVYAWNAWVCAEAPRLDDVETLAWAVRDAYGVVVGP